MTLNLKDEILKLWNEARNPLYIAQKLGIVDEKGDPDIDKVTGIILGYADDERDKRHFAIAEERVYGS